MPSEYTGFIEEMSKMTGFSRAQILDMWEQVKANRAALESCTGPHEFEKIDERHYKCKLCDGLLRNAEKRWYEIGVRHGRNSK